jgi:deoxycytidylate deaminase
MRVQDDWLWSTAACNSHVFRLQVHAEANALLNTNTSSISGATLYVTMHPCNECAKLLIQAGIARVVFFEVCASVNTLP